jgi:hypothetical protein
MGFGTSATMERYTLRIMGPSNDSEVADDTEAREILGSVVQEAESLISDSLPEGYYAKIEQQ